MTEEQKNGEPTPTSDTFFTDSFYTGSLLQWSNANANARRAIATYCSGCYSLKRAVIIIITVLMWASSGRRKRRKNLRIPEAFECPLPLPLPLHPAGPRPPHLTDPSTTQKWSLFKGHRVWSEPLNKLSQLLSVLQSSRLRLTSSFKMQKTAASAPKNWGR